MAYNPNIPTVTGNVAEQLDQMRENFTHLGPLAQITDDLQAVSGLAPYVQAILDSRIVDHNLDVAEPLDGWYVRWENGLQVCWFVDNPIPYFTARTEGAVSGYAHSTTWTYPAVFIENPSVAVIGSGYATSQLQTSLNTSIVGLSTISVGIHLWAWNQVNNLLTICRIAIGRWK